MGVSCIVYGGKMLSGFLGIYYYSNKDVSGEEIDRLEHSVLGPGKSTYCSYNCGQFAARICLPPSANSSHFNMAFLECSDKVIIFSGSIYNKSKLSKQLMCDDGLADIRIAETAWNHWGENASEYIDGDWMYAVFDKRGNKLSIARSWGFSSMYYYVDEEKIIFATHPGYIHRYSDQVYKPNITAILQTIYVSKSNEKASFFDNVTQLPASTRLIASSQNLETFCWWRPSQVNKIKVLDEEAVFEEFKSLYTKAVEKRIETNLKVGATLSAGLDSSSICAIAANSLQKRGLQLMAWTSTPLYKDISFSSGNWLTDEGEMATELVKRYSNIDHHIIQSRETNPVDSLKRQVKNSGRPLRAAANFYWIDAIINQAKKYDCDVLLIGQGGNNTISWTPGKIPVNPAEFQKFFSSVSVQGYLSYTKRVFLRWIKTKKSNWVNGNERHSLVNTLLNKEFQKSDLLLAFKKKAIFKKTATHAEAAEAHINLMDIWYHIGFWSGIEVRDPTIDKALMKLLMSLPENMYFRDGLDRRVIRIGMEGILPDKIRLNKRRGQQSSDIVERISSSIDEVEILLRRIEKNHMVKEMINLIYGGDIIRRIRQGERGIDITKDVSMVLLPALSIGVFLEAFNDEHHIAGHKIPIS